MAELRFPHIQQKIRLADGLEFANRLIFPAVSTNMADDNGCPTQAMVDFYERRAAGGVGGIIIGGAAVREDGGVTRHSQRLHNRSQEEGLRRLARVIKRYCPVGIQLYHAGGQGNPDYTGFPLTAPSAYLHPPIGHWARALEKAEIEGVRDAFINGVIKAFDSGVDFVELHLAHGYLLHEFLSPYFNKRQDEYGGSLENRGRLLFEILDRLEAADHFYLTRTGLRVSGADFVEGGITLDFYQWLLPRLKEMKLLYFHVTAGIYDSSEEKKKAMQQGGFQELAGQFKKLTNRPIITVGNIFSVNRAEEVVRAGSADLVAMARALIADPDLPARSFSGELSALHECSGCNRCHYLAFRKPDLTVACRRLPPPERTI